MVIQNVTKEQMRQLLAGMFPETFSVVLSNGVTSEQKTWINSICPQALSSAPAPANDIGLPTPQKPTVSWVPPTLDHLEAVIPMADHIPDFKKNLSDLVSSLIPSVDDLGHFVRHSALNEPGLENIVKTSQPAPYVVFDLISHYSRNSNLGLLIYALIDRVLRNSGKNGIDEMEGFLRKYGFLV